MKKLNARIDYLFDMYCTLVECAETSADYEVLMRKARKVYAEYERLCRVRNIRDNILIFATACGIAVVVYPLAVLAIICFG